MTYPHYSDEERESRFTRRGSFCTNPENWHSADGDSTEYEVLELVAGFVRGLQPEIVIETGSAYGFGSKAIGEALRANGHGKLYSLEIDPERIAISKQRVAGLPVEIVGQASLSWTPPDKVQFAFFDSLIPLRAQEFLYFRPFIEPGSIVAFHDAAPHHGLYPELIKLEGMLRLIRLRTPRGIVFAEVL
jgi:predicted O-methyltransferase YrrM